MNNNINNEMNDSINKYTLDYIPSVAEMGLQACGKGNFEAARRFFNIAIQQIQDPKNQQKQLIDLMVNIADSYFSEGSADLAKIWYSKALNQSQYLENKNTLNVACLLCKLAEVHVLVSEIDKHNKYFELVKRIYLTSQESDLSSLLYALADLSWALSVKGYVDEAKATNMLIMQIRQLQEEDKLNRFEHSAA